MLFNEQGILNLDELVMTRPSFRKIMEDGIVTDEELEAQADAVVSLMHRIEQNSTPEQLHQIEELLAEMGVLFSVYHYHELQSIRR